MRRSVVVSVAVAMVLATSVGCTGSWDRCPEADADVVEQIMAGARTDFRPVLPDGRPGIQIDHLETIGSSVGRLPENDRKFGADQLLVLSIWTYVGEEDASGDFGRIKGEVLFVLDADGKLLGPADEFTASLFDLSTPADPGWQEWGEKLIESSTFSELATCVDPD